MALQATTLTNSSAGTQTSTNNSHDGDTGTNDNFTVDASQAETIQWGFSGSPVDWQKFRVRASATSTTNGEIYIYIIPTGESDPANYTLVYSNTSPSNPFDVTYTHGSTISADGIYIKFINGNDTAHTVYVKEVECWDEAGAGGNWPHDIGGVANAGIGEIGGVAIGDIDEVGGVS